MEEKPYSKGHWRVNRQMLSTKGDIVRDQNPNEDQEVENNPFKNPPNKLTTKRGYDREKG